jgi:predicted nucleic acid-binding protein
MEDGRRKRRLNDWLTKELPIRFAGRILVIDAIVADAAGAIVSDRILKGRKMQAMDALIAATAVTYGLTVVTRDVRDFVGSVTSILNPWLANEA